MQKYKVFHGIFITLLKSPFFVLITDYRLQFLYGYIILGVKHKNTIKI